MFVLMLTAPFSLLYEGLRLIRRGGLIVLPHGPDIDLSYQTTDAVASALYHKMFVALSRVMEARGIDLA